MRVMAIAARLIGVSTDGVLAVLRAIVASHARALGAGGERVAVLARGRVDAGMQRRWLTGMTALADVGGGRREAGGAVAGIARDFADVRDVTCARRDIVIGRRHLLRYVISAGTAAPDHERDQREQAHHGRDPIG